jgi:hypothetical protein
MSTPQSPNHEPELSHGRKSYIRCSISAFFFKGLESNMLHWLRLFAALMIRLGSVEPGPGCGLVLSGRFRATTELQRSPMLLQSSLALADTVNAVTAVLGLNAAS